MVGHHFSGPGDGRAHGGPGGLFVVLFEQQSVLVQQETAIGKGPVSRGSLCLGRRRPCPGRF